MNAMSIPEVMGLHQLSRSVSRETQHLCGFLRFQELQNDILYARLVSKHHVGMFLAEHFQDRLPMEHWVIHDVEWMKSGFTEQVKTGFISVIRTSDRIRR